MGLLSMESQMQMSLFKVVTFIMVSQIKEEQ